ncbi:glycosyltransferase family 4 protein [Dyadobacter sp. CY323]|uniref:glycosyltransferase family 4 protein n=1 Tax=Dyadobacter sp. CY323 TaxID=2907302 RepID=UPI001F469E2A|nr:glycosyltransferase family 4 protein [Dyadobacter sp. CY323]MCE6990869.1 glycosyltransferase family 4 protein [Dyadobacter sp. CY323]
MEKARLVYVLHDIQVGGVEVALISAIPTLYRNFDLNVIVLGKIDNRMVANLSDEQKSCFKTFNYPLITYPATLPGIAYYIVRLRPKILVSSLWRASLLGVMVKKSLPGLTFISFVHSTTFFHKLDKLFTKAALRNADHVFTDSTATSQFVQKELHGSTDVTVISFFIQKSPDEKVNAPHTGDVRFMFLGRMNKVKNLTLTVDTIMKLRSRGLNVSLDLYGPDDGMLKNLQQYIEQNQLGPIIKYKGEVNADQKAAAFNEHHFLIQLSSHEGMAMSVAEAMQRGLVCFTTPVGEIKNYADDMRTAVFANIWEDAEWEKSIDKIADVVADPAKYEQISTNCFRQFQNVETYSTSLSNAISTHV